MTKCDEEIATLKDELFHQNKCMRESMINTKPSAESAEPEQPVARIDASQYPSQERRPTTAPSHLEEMSSTESSTNASASAGSNNEICLHIVSSSHGLYIQMKVCDDLTVLNLKNKLASRLLLLGNYSIDLEAYSLSHKEQELSDSSLSLNQCQIGNGAALVLMPQRQPVPPSHEEKKEEQVVDQVITSNVESKLDEILQAVRTLSSKDIHLQDDSGNKQQLSSQSPLSKLNVQELVETEQSDCAESESKNEQSSRVAHSSSYSGEETMDPSDGNGGKQGKVGVQLKVDTSPEEVHDGKVSPFNPPSEIEVTSEDTSGEDYLPHKKMMKDGVGEYNGACDTLASSSLQKENSLGYSVSESQLDYTNSVKSSPNNSTSHEIEAIEEVTDEKHTPTPSTGFLDRDIPREEAKGIQEVDMSDSEIRAMWKSEAVQPSSETKSEYSSFHGEAQPQQFRFSDFESEEKDEEADESVEGRFNADETIEYPDEEFNADDIPNLQISSAKGATMESASDMQSIEISFSEFVPNVEEKVEDDDGGNLKSGGSKMGCFSFLKKNKKHTRSTKKMRLPKWNKSRKKGNVQGDIVEL